MPTADSLLYYIVMFGSVILIPLLIGALAFSISRYLRNQRPRQLMVSGILLTCLLIAALVNPLVNMIIFVPGSNARVAEMHRTAAEEKFRGRSIGEFIQRFGSPDRVTKLNRGGASILVYTCRPWIAYGWDELVVYTAENKVTGIVIDD